MDGPKLRLTGGPLDHGPFGQLSFVNLDGPNTLKVRFTTLVLINRDSLFHF